MVVRFRLSFEYLIFASFILGLISGWIVGVDVRLLSIISEVFLGFLLTFAPVIVFVVVFSSAYRILNVRVGAFRLVFEAVLIFVALMFVSSICTSLLIPFLFCRLSDGAVGLHVPQVRILLNPILLSVFIALFLSYLFNRHFRLPVVDLIVERISVGVGALFRALTYLMPLIIYSLAFRLYFRLGLTSSVAFCLIAVILVLAVCLPFLLLPLTFIALRVAGVGLKLVLKYLARALFLGLFIGSSYLILPIHVRIVREELGVKPEVGDLIVTLGAMLNRCGSIAGLVISTLIAMHIMNLRAPIGAFLILSLLIPLIGIGSPGIHGGTMMACLPVIIELLSPHDVSAFTSLAFTFFAGAATFSNAAINTATTGLTAIIVNRKFESHRSG
ncbi:MAG: dicarboxylate/amino acid:cation symporter [archaeon GB-1867-005]|nr:dicarboxylate/amino acid:cation symporter [Candidatus Culexmicrobium cathedralense]